MWFASLVTHMNHPKPGQGFIHRFSNSNTNSRTIFSQDKAPTPFHDIQGPSASGPHLPFPSSSPNPLQSLLEALNVPVTKNNS